MNNGHMQAMDAVKKLHERISDLEEKNKFWQLLHNTNNLIPIEGHRRIVEELKIENSNVQSYNESIISEFNKQKQQLKSANELISKIKEWTKEQYNLTFLHRDMLRERALLETITIFISNSEAKYLEVEK